MDLRNLTDEQLDELRIEVRIEQERRAKLAQLPDALAAMALDAALAGCDPDLIRDRVNDALTPQD